MAETTTLTRTIDGVEVPETGVYALDKAHTVVGFVVRHMMVSKVRGSFKDFEGTVTVADDVTASSVEAVIQMASIDTREDTRDNHLRTSDFFEVEKFPTMSYKSSSLRRSGRGWVLEGELTLHGVTRPVSLELEFNGATKDPYGGTRVGFSAAGEVDREAFGLTYNSALEAGGVVIGKTVQIEIEAEAILQA